MCLFDEFFDQRAQARIRSDGGAFPERARARRVGPGLRAVRARRVSGKGLPPVRGIIPRGTART